ncbi:uncharacterized protein LOC143460298 [Clavelina lepadiformis]|uniref:uncharacterized protein LOC143460298 n=1 Tax=Clavelina lepadiformis TaxID=159417 RepID=UPI004043728F
MCDQANGLTEIILDYEPNMKSTFYVEVPFEGSLLKENPKESSRKRKCTSIPYQYKIKRKSVEKIHVSVDRNNTSSFSHISQFPQTSNVNDDHDTEKYLTKSAKKTKPSDKCTHKQDKNEDLSNVVLSNYKLDCDSTSLEQSTVQVMTNDYGEQFVVTLYPGAESNITSTANTKDNVIMSSTNSSFMKIGGTNSFFISSSFSEANETQLCSSMTADSSDLIYSIPNTSVQLDGEKTLQQRNLKAKRSSAKRKLHSKLPASADFVDDPVRNLWVTTKSHKEQLKENGHSWTTGMWSTEETEILKQNIQNYCVGRGVKDPTDIIFNASKEERKDFYPTVSSGLNRPLFAVYRRIRRLYDKRNYKGKYSSEELLKLQELRKVHGRDWTQIAQQLGRSSDSVKDRCRLLRDDLTVGKWADEEEERLAKAVHAVTNTEPGESVTDGIPWGHIANLVGTRTDKQCRAKWLNYLNWKQVQGHEWTKFDDKLLVGKISELLVSSDNEIDWNKLCVGWKSVRSPQWLRGKWVNLKKMLAESDIVGLNFNDTVQLLNKLFSEEIFKMWDRPKQMLKFVMEEQAKMNELETSHKVKLDDGSDIDDSSNITTSVISQAENTSSAPLFLQTNDPDQLLSSDLINISENADESNSASKHSLNAIVRPRTSSESNQPKANFELGASTGVLCDMNDSPLSLPLGTYHLTPTSSDGIFIIQPSDTPPTDGVTLSTTDNRFVNITLAPDVLNSMLKLGEATSTTDGINLEGTGSDPGYIPNSSRENPILSSVAHDITITTQENPL